MSPRQSVLRVGIDRSRWLRGSTATTLRNRDSGHECVVASIARSAGIPIDDIETYCRIGARPGERLPASLAQFDTDRNDTSWSEDPRAPEQHVPTACLLYRINDDPLLADTVREQMLATVAARIGIELTFTRAALPPHAIAPTTDGRARQAAASRGEHSQRPTRRLRLKMDILSNARTWEPLHQSTLNIDADPEAAWAYAYDLVRNKAYEHQTAVRITVLDAATGRTMADAYHESVR